MVQLETVKRRILKTKEAKNAKEHYQETIRTDEVAGYARQVAKAVLKQNMD